MIRKAFIEDLDEIEQMYIDVCDSLSVGINYANWKNGLYPDRETAEDGIVNGELYIYEVDGKIAGNVIINKKQPIEYKDAKWGYDCTDDEVVVVHTLMVSPKYRGLGIGRKLLLFVEEMGVKMDCIAVRLDTFEDNGPACQLYLKTGYTYRGFVDLKLPSTSKLFKCFDKKIR